MQYDIYTDGSYREFGDLGKFYSGAAVIMNGQDNHPTILTKAGCDADIISMRNVAGEIVAVMMAMEHCLNVLDLSNKDVVNLYYDYQGIEDWVLGKWRAKNPTTQAYKAYMNSIIRPRFTVNFHHVKGHSGILGNELADKYAGQAISQLVENLSKGK